MQVCDESLNVESDIQVHWQKGNTFVFHERSWKSMDCEAHAEVCWAANWVGKNGWFLMSMKKQNMHKTFIAQMVLFKGLYTSAMFVKPHFQRATYFYIKPLKYTALFYKHRSIRKKNCVLSYDLVTWKIK